MIGINIWEDHFHDILKIQFSTKTCQSHFKNFAPSDKNFTEKVYDRLRRQYTKLFHLSFYESNEAAFYVSTSSLSYPMSLKVFLRDCTSAKPIPKNTHLNF